MQTHHPEKEIFSIQALRGIAAMLVVFAHSSQFISPFLTAHTERYLGHDFGNFGVDIFFVISGFIMVYISHHDFGKKGTAGPFLLRRFIRIFPMYWLLTIVILLITIPSGLYSYGWPEGEQVIIPYTHNSIYVLKSFLLIPFFNAAAQNPPPILGVAWTLIYEMFFYYIFCLLLLFNRKTYLWVLMGVFAVLLFIKHLFVSFPLFLDPRFSCYLVLYGNQIILEFLFGCIIAELYLSNKFLPNKLAVLAILFAIFDFVFNYHYPWPWYRILSPFTMKLLATTIYGNIAVCTGIPAFLLVYGALSLEANKAIKIPKILVHLGDASYSIYMTHFAISLLLCIAILKELKQHLFTVPGDLAILLAWIFCVIFGYLAYRYVEAPLTKLIKRWVYRNKKRTSK